MNENNFEFLDMLTIVSFCMQIKQIENSNKHMQKIEEKLDYIIQKLDLVDDQVLKSLQERYDNNL
jgi:hypothetical protein